MSRLIEQIRCQNCRAVNSLERELCARCGTRLMLVHVPATSRVAFEQQDVCDEHLLERVSLLENSLSRLTGKLEQTLDLMLRQARTAQIDHALLETLIGVLGESGVLNQVKLAQAWQKHCARETEQSKATRGRKDLRERILAACDKSETAAADFIRRGFALLDGDDRTRGIRTLERAAAIAPKNKLLNAFLGQHFFRAGKTKLAHSYLSKAYESAPENGGVGLLLGLLCGDEGDLAQAKELLSEAARNGRGSFAAHYALGRLSVAEENWTEALAQFKKALAARSCPEAHYVVGLAYLRLKRNRLALRHLAKAVEMDAGYADAIYALGLAHLRLDDHEAAAKAFDAARAAGSGDLRRKNPPARATKLKFASKSAVKAEPPPPALLQPLPGRGKKKAITGGDERLASVVREDALKAATDFD